MSSRQSIGQLIRASAGTGKTFQLTNQYLRLILGNKQFDSILATTFTRKAAGEILERVILRLAEAASDSRKQAELDQFLHVQENSTERYQELLVQLLQNMHRLHIGTLDSFFSKLVQSHLWELGLPSNWHIASEVEDQAFRQQAISKTFISKGKECDDEMLVLLQMLAKGDVDIQINQLLLSTIKDVYQDFLATSASAWEYPRLPELFSQATANEQADQLIRLVQNERTTLIKATEKLAGAIQNHQWEAFLTHTIVKNFHAGNYKYSRSDKGITTAYIETVHSLSEYAANKIYNQYVERVEAIFRVFTEYDHYYHQLKQIAGAVQFSDLTRLLAGYMANRHSHEGSDKNQHSFGFRLDAKINHLLLDEFQDTSYDQWKVISPFVKQAMDNHDDSAALFCVGDTKQAIYGWRGGVAEIFDTLEERFTSLDLLSLAQSFRSSAVVIDAVNQIFHQLTSAPVKEQYQSAIASWSERFPLHSTAKSELPGYVQMKTLPAKEEIKENPFLKYETMAETIKDVYEKHPGYSIGVIAFTNNMVSAMVHQLQKMGLPASEEGGNYIDDVAPVHLIISLLKLADHPGDLIARYHVANSPLGISFQCQDIEDDLRIAELSRKIRREITYQGYGETIRGWGEILIPHCNMREKQRLKQLQEIAEGYKSLQGDRVSYFIDYLQSQRLANSSENLIRVTNTHQAKGLEYDIVFLVELDKKILGQTPAYICYHSKELEQIEKIFCYVPQAVLPFMPEEIQQISQKSIEGRIQESLCKLYVALTRARRALYLFVTPQKPDAETSQYGTMIQYALNGEPNIEPNSVIYESGNSNWAGKELSQQTKNQEEELNEIAINDETTIKLAKWDGIHRRLQNISPSSLEGGELTSARSLLAAKEESVRFTFGNLIHLWLEQIQWSDQPRPSKEKALEIAQAKFFCREEEMEDAWNKYCSFIEKPQFQLLLTRDDHAEQTVFNEYHFAVQRGDHLIQGSIDRLVYTYHPETKELISAEIVDFKTDRFEEVCSETEIEAKASFYRPQLQAYQQAVMQMTGLPAEEVTTKLFFLRLDLAITIEI